MQLARSSGRVVWVGWALAIAVLALAARAPAGGGPGCRAEKPWVDEEAGRLVFFAVLEGLYLDGVQQDVVQALLPQPEDGQGEALFVPGCPICAPAQAALATYASRGPLGVKKFDEQGRPVDTFGPGLERVVVAELTTGARPQRLAALQPLVQRWVAARLDRLRLSASERTSVRRWMEDASKQGGMQLGELRRSDPAAADWKACAVCDGAADACRRADEG